MDLTLDSAVAQGLRSQSQIARRITEHWAENNLFCLSCPSNKLAAARTGYPVQDFTCPKCNTTYQLKSKNGRHGNQVANSAYHPKITSIRQGQAPSYAFLEYSRNNLKVTSLFVVPGHFITESIIQRRPPLPPTARRAGWIGSNLLLSKLPSDARIPVVLDGHPVEPDIVRNEWNKFRFLKTDPRASGGWGVEILSAVRQLQSTAGQDTFTLQQFYGLFRASLASLHPENHHIEARVRRQLQLLRDNRILEFLGRGNYRIIG